MTRSTVGLNLLWLVPGAVGGSEQSTLASVRALRDLAPDDLSLRLFALAPFADAHPDVVDSFPTELLPVSGRSRAARIVAESTWLATRTRRLDLVHHAGGTAPLVRGAPYVLTVHDLQPLERQATHGTGKRAYLAAAIPPSVRRARAVAVPSDFVRRSVLDHVDVDPARVVTVPHGVSAPKAPSAAAEADVRSRFGLLGPVVLYPAITYPHKNHATLVTGFAQLRRTHPEAVLVLTGAPGSAEPDLVQQVRALDVADGVRRLGRVSEAEVAALFRVASVVAVPSTYEGFGLPAAEAMAAGVPVVASDATSLPEVVGDAGVLVDPMDPAAWAAALAGILDDPDRASGLARRGLERVTRFSWGANAAAFADLYRRALGEG